MSKLLVGPSLEDVESAHHCASRDRVVVEPPTESAAPEVPR